jgi:transcription elongation factor Elf1
MATQPAPQRARPEACDQCGRELVVISLLVDGTNLVMRSCATCDTRTWHLGSCAVDLETALSEVGQAAGRQRP